MFVRIFICLTLALFGTAWAQTPSIPRTRDGHPDFQGVWNSNWITGLERLPLANKFVLTQAEETALLAAMQARFDANPFIVPSDLLDSKSLLRTRGEIRSSILVDPPGGELPFTDEGRRLLERLRAAIGRQDGPEALALTERCLWGMMRAPILVSPANMYRRIVQTPDHLVIHTEHYSDLRIVDIGGSHRPAALTLWAGDSIAHWDGDTLVVEVTNLRSDDLRVGGPMMFGPAARHFLVRPEAKVVERFSFVTPDELLYRFTVEDPVVYSHPWTGEYSWIRSDQPIYEFACHEGNYGLPGILKGARETDRSAATVAKAKPQ